MRKNVYIISVLFAVLGLGLMYLSTSYIEPEKVDIGDIERVWTGENVEVTGNITHIRESEGHLFITLEDGTGDILVVDFDSDVELERGNEISVTGYVEIYHGTLEIIAEEIVEA